MPYNNPNTPDTPSTFNEIIDNIQAWWGTPNLSHFVPTPISNQIDVVNVIIDVKQEVDQSTGIASWKLTMANVGGAAAGGIVFFVGEATTASAALATMALGGLPGLVGSVAIFYEGSVATVKLSEGVTALTHDEILDLLTTPGILEAEDIAGNWANDLMKSLNDVMGKTTGWNQQPFWLNDLMKGYDLTLAGVRDVGEFLKDRLDSFLADAQTVSDFVLDTFKSLKFGEATNAPPTRMDPLTFDLDGDGIDLVSVTNSTAFFDLDITEVPAGTVPGNNQSIYTAPDGKTYLSDGTKEQVGWIGSDDALLVYDKNNNGKIDNILELFGKSNKTGTQELKEYDSNFDNKINSSDAVFSQLKLWRDLNQNGISESNELKSLSEYNITSINVDVESLSPVNQTVNGNLIISQGSYTKSTIDGDVTAIYGNLDLAVNQSNSTSYTYTDNSGNVIGGYDLNLEALTLPMSRGYGNVVALPIAASKNTDLLEALKSLKNLSINNISQIDTIVEDIIFKWAGTKDVTGMRGSFDGRKLATLEEFRGEIYTTTNNSHNVAAWQENFVNQAWTNLFNTIKAKLLAQSLFQDVFAKTVNGETVYPTYDFSTDAINYNSITKTEILENIVAKFNSITSNLSTATDLETASKINEIYAASDRANFILQIQSLLKTFSESDFADFNQNTIQREIREALLANEESAQTARIQLGTLQNDNVYGDIGNGNDINAYGQYVDPVENNILLGSKGDDNLIGLKGNDTYLFNKGDGKDLINEFGRGFNNEEEMSQNFGTDTILFGVGISKDDIYLTGDGYDLTIKFKSNDADQIIVRSQFAQTNKIEKLLFSNGDEINLTDPNLRLSFYGTSANDIQTGSILKDTFEASAGNDYLLGKDGDDIYKFNRGSGIDVISEYGALYPYTNQLVPFANNNDLNYYWNGVGTPHSQVSLGTDTIEFAFGITEEELKFFINYQDLIINFGNSPTDQLVIRDQFFGQANRIEYFKFFYQKSENGELLFDLQGNPILEERIVSLADKDWSQMVFELKGNDDKNDNISAGNAYNTKNIIDGQGGNDEINASTNANNEVKGGAGNDMITTGIGNDLIEGNSGNDIIGAGNGNDNLDGGADDDELNGGEGEDLIIGGLGNDNLLGGVGNDTYIYNLGDGQDIINDVGNHLGSGGVDKISFAVGIAQENLVLRKSATNNDLIITFNNSASDQITLKKYFDYRDQVEYFEFSTLNSNGEIVKNQIRVDDLIVNNFEGTNEVDYINGTEYKDVINAYDGNDNVRAEGGDDIINGGKGDDNLWGGGGNDKYIYNLGDGADTINELGNYNINNFSNWDFGSDAIEFGAGISKEDLSYSIAGTSLIINFKNSTTDQITIQNHFYGVGPRVESLKFANGDVIDLINPQNLQFNIVGATEGNDQIYGFSYGRSPVYNEIIDAKDGNDKIFAGGGNNTFIGGKGDDIINDSGGNDAYIFNIGDGSDSINENGGNDKIKFGAGITKASIYFANENGLTIKFFNSESDKINVTSFFNQTTRRVEILEFADGSTIDLNNLTQENYLNYIERGKIVNGTSASEFLQGGAGDDTLIYSNDKSWSAGFVARNIGSPDAINLNPERITIAPRVGNTDVFEGGDGIDTIQMSNANEALFLDDIYSAKPLSTHQARVSNVEIINAGAGDDIIDLTSKKYSYGDVTLNGEDGNDVLWANAGNDKINGGNGNDNIDGGSGNDIINGGLGIDILYGKKGNDIFKYDSLNDSTLNASDIIKDFKRGEDKIDLSDLGFNSIIKDQNNSSANGLEYHFEGGNTVIQDQSGFAIKLAGEINLDNGDFIFS